MPLSADWVPSARDSPLYFSINFVFSSLAHSIFWRSLQLQSLQMPYRLNWATMHHQSTTLRQHSTMHRSQRLSSMSQSYVFERRILFLFLFSWQLIWNEMENKFFIVQFVGISKVRIQLWHQRSTHRRHQIAGRRTWRWCCQGTILIGRTRRFSAYRWLHSRRSQWFQCGRP